VIQICLGTATRRFTTVVALSLSSCPIIARPASDRKFNNRASVFSVEINGVAVSISFTVYAKTPVHSVAITVNAPTLFTSFTYVGNRAYSYISMRKLSQDLITVVS